MKLQKVYHVGIPVDDLDRARDFYTKVLGTEYLGRVGGNPNNPDALPIHGNVQRLDRLRCGDDDIVLFERPRRHRPSSVRHELGRLRRRAQNRQGAWQISSQRRARQRQYHLPVRFRGQLSRTPLPKTGRPARASGGIEEYIRKHTDERTN